VKSSSRDVVPGTLSYQFNRPPALYRLTGKTHTRKKGPVWAFSFSEKPLQALCRGFYP